MDREHLIEVITSFKLGVDLRNCEITSTKVTESGSQFLSVKLTYVDLNSANPLEESDEENWYGGMKTNLNKLIEQTDQLLRAGLPVSYQMQESETSTLKKYKDMGEQYLQKKLEEFRTLWRPKEKKEENEEDENFLEAKSFFYCIVKLPPSKELRIGDISCYQKEVMFYADALPLLRAFMVKRKLFAKCNVFPKYFGSTTMADDSIVMIRDIKEKRYYTCSKMTGFSHTETMYILTKMACFHAVGMAFREHRPNMFQLHIRPLLNQTLDTIVTKDNLDRVMKFFESKSLFTPDSLALRKHFEHHITYMKHYYTKPTDYRYYSMVHQDLSPNHIYLKRDQKRRICHARFIDFKTLGYHSVANDVMWFLLNSINYKDLDVNLEVYLYEYFSALVTCLCQFGVSAELYSFEGFLEEVSLYARRVQLPRTFSQLGLFFSKKKGKAADAITIDDCLPDEEDLHRYFYPKLYYLLTTFTARGWVEFA